MSKNLFDIDSKTEKQLMSENTDTKKATELSADKKSKNIVTFDEEDIKQTVLCETIVLYKSYVKITHLLVDHDQQEALLLIKKELREGINSFALLYEFGKFLLDFENPSFPVDKIFDILSSLFYVTDGNLLLFKSYWHLLITRHFYVVTERLLKLLINIITENISKITRTLLFIKLHDTNGSHFGHHLILHRETTTRLLFDLLILILKTPQPTDSLLENYISSVLEISTSQNKNLQSLVSLAAQNPNSTVLEQCFKLLEILAEENYAPARLISRLLQVDKKNRNFGHVTWYFHGKNEAIKKRLITLLKTLIENVDGRAQPELLSFVLIFLYSEDEDKNSVADIFACKELSLLIGQIICEFWSGNDTDSIARIVNTQEILKAIYELNEKRKVVDYVLSLDHASDPQQAFVKAVYNKNTLLYKYFFILPDEDSAVAYQIFAPKNRTHLQILDPLKQLKDQIEEKHDEISDLPTDINTPRRKSSQTSRPAQLLYMFNRPIDLKLHPELTPDKLDPAILDEKEKNVPQSPQPVSVLAQPEPGTGVVFHLGVPALPSEESKPQSKDSSFWSRKKSTISTVGRAESGDLVSTPLSPTSPQRSSMLKNPQKSALFLNRGRRTTTAKKPARHPHNRSTSVGSLGRFPGHQKSKSQIS